MSASFHDKPYDEGTLTKLELFERYAEAWLPVFVARDEIIWPEVSIYDFFSGPGHDSLGNNGSPLRLLKVIQSQGKYLHRPGLKVRLRLSDSHAGKVAALKQTMVAECPPDLPVTIEIVREAFADRFEQVLPQLAADSSANLLIIDQFGVSEVPNGVFERITELKTTDVLFFVSSNTFRRFADVPEVARLQLPDYQRPEDYYRAHLAVADAYRELIPRGRTYFIASFSIKKGSNVYGVIFGSQHPLGMDKFLEVAWNKDKVSGEADFDVHREGITPNAPSLFEEFNVPKKLRVFGEVLEREILEGRCADEAAMIQICHAHGVTRRHAAPILAELKARKQIVCDFKVPDIKRLKTPRKLTLI